MRYRAARPSRISELPSLLPSSMNSNSNGADRDSSRLSRTFTSCSARGTRLSHSSLMGMTTEAHGRVGTVMERDQILRAGVHRSPRATFYRRNRRMVKRVALKLNERSPLLSFPLSIVERQLFEFRIQHLAVDAQEASGFGLVAGRASQGAGDQETFERACRFLHRQRQ